MNHGNFLLTLAGLKVLCLSTGTGRLRRCLLTGGALVKRRRRHDIGNMDGPFALDYFPLRILLAFT